MKRRLLCVLLALMLCVGLLPMAALAASEEPDAAAFDGAEETTYTVSAIADPAEGGTVTVKNAAGEVCSQFKAGETVQIEAVPESGYRLISIMVTLDDCGALTEVGNSFVVPALQTSNELDVWVTFEKEDVAKVTYHLRDAEGEDYTIWRTAEVGEDFVLLTDASNSKDAIVTGFMIGETVYALGATVRITGDTDIYAVYSEETGIELAFRVEGGLVLLYVAKGSEVTMEDFWDEDILGWSNNYNGSLDYELGKTYTFYEDKMFFPASGEDGNIDEGDEGDEGDVHVINIDINCPEYEIESGYLLNIEYNPRNTTEAEMLDVLKYSLEEEEPIRTGYTLLGWALDAAGTQLWDGTTLPANGSTLYAVWEKDLVVTFKSDTDESWFAVSFKRDRTTLKSFLDEVNGALEMVARDGYTAKYWTETKGSEERYAPTEVPESDVVLYPVWVADIVMADEESGVSVSVPGTLEDAETLTLVVEPLDETSEKKVETVLVAKVNGDVEKTYILDIYFINEDGEEMSVDSLRTVTIPIPEGWDAKNTAVYYVDTETGAATNMNAVVSSDGKSISFVTDHFSYYALVQTAAKQSAPATGSTSKSIGGTPKTGDESNLIVWAAILVVACGGAVVLTRRKKEN